MLKASVNRNFVVLRSSGECLFQWNFGTGPDLDISSLSSFASAVATLGNFMEGSLKGGRNNAKDLRNSIIGRSSMIRSSMTAGKSGTGGGSLLETVAFAKENKELLSHRGAERASTGMVRLCGKQLVYKHQAGFVFFLNSPSAEEQDTANRQLYDVLSILTYLLGPVEKWKRNNISFHGLESIVEASLVGPLKSPERLVGGMPFVAKSAECKQALHELLGSLENDEYTQGTMLLVGTSVLHTRLSQEDSRLIRHFVALCDLSPWQRVQLTPVFSDGRWKNLVVFQMKWYVLCVLASIECSLPGMLPKLEVFEQQLIEKIQPLDLPVAETCLKVEDFGGLDLVGFVYHDCSTGHTLFPDMRDEPSKQVHVETLSWFIRRAQELFTAAGISSVHLQKGGYRFFASEDDGFEVFLLFGANVDPVLIEDEADQVINKIRLGFTL